MTRFSRRDFLRTGLAAGALAGAGSLPLQAEPARATDWVTLGKSGVKVTRLAFGTGTFSGRVQRSLGQKEFTRQVRHAYDRGIRFFETSETYPGMHEMLGIALQGIPRESYRLMSKLNTDDESAAPLRKIDELRKQAKTDYFDLMLLHHQYTSTWPQDTVRWQQGVLEAEAKHMVVAHGASIHGLPALRRCASNRWLDIAMIRMNQKGVRMDAEQPDTSEPGDVPAVVKNVKSIRAAGIGVISMKLVGEGRFTTREDRQAAMRFAFRNAGVNAVTVGYKSTAEIDEAIENLNLALA